jgi:hypothetical protein
MLGSVIAVSDCCTSDGSNRFRPADRDTIFQLAREQLVTTAGELEVRAARRGVSASCSKRW